MEAKLEDGTGKGHKAAVDHENRLKVFAVVEPEDKHVNRIHGTQWSLPFKVTPAGANSYFFYLRNDSENLMSISDIRIKGAQVEDITYEWVKGTPSYTSGTAITAVTRNAGSFKTPNVTCYKDTSTTGITADGEIFFESIDTPNKRYKLSTSSNIIIPQGKAIAFRAGVGGAEIRAIVSLTELEH